MFNFFDVQVLCLCMHVFCSLWEILIKIGCPHDFVTIIRSFHDGMRAMVVENGDLSPSFDVANGTKQGCVLAPLLFIIFFSMMLLIAFKDCTLASPFTIVPMVMCLMRNGCRLRLR